MTERMVETNVYESPKGSAKSAAPYAGAGRARRVPNGSLGGWSAWLLEAEIDAIELHQLVDSEAYAESPQETGRIRPMSESSLLETTAEVAVAFAGFIGIVFVLIARKGQFPGSVRDPSQRHRGARLPSLKSPVERPRR